MILGYSFIPSRLTVYVFCSMVPRDEGRIFLTLLGRLLRPMSDGGKRFSSLSTYYGGKLDYLKSKGFT